MFHSGGLLVPVSTLVQLRLVMCLRTRPITMAARADALIERVLAASSVYDALGVARGATLDDVRKTYRKYCLRVHPDKCKVCASA